MIENLIRQRLVTTAAVNAITGDRVTLGTADQGERRPRIVLTLISSPRERTLDDDAPTFRTGTVQVACLAPTYRAAHDLAEAATDALDGHSAGAIEHLEAEDAEDIDTAPLEGQATPTFGKAITVWFMHKR